MDRYIRVYVDANGEVEVKKLAVVKEFEDRVEFKLSKYLSWTGLVDFNFTLYKNDFLRVLEGSHETREVVCLEEDIDLALTKLEHSFLYDIKRLREERERKDKSMIELARCRYEITRGEDWLK